MADYSVIKAVKAPGYAYQPAPQVLNYDVPAKSNPRAQSKSAGTIAAKPATSKSTSKPVPKMSPSLVPTSVAPTQSGANSMAEFNINDAQKPDNDWQTRARRAFKAKEDQLVRERTQWEKDRTSFTRKIDELGRAPSPEKSLEITRKKRDDWTVPMLYGAGVGATAGAVLAVGQAAAQRKAVKDYTKAAGKIAAINKATDGRIIAGTVTGDRMSSTAKGAKRRISNRTLHGLVLSTAVAGLAETAYGHFGATDEASKDFWQSIGRGTLAAATGAEVVGMTLQSMTWPRASAVSTGHVDSALQRMKREQKLLRDRGFKGKNAPMPGYADVARQSPTKEALSTLRPNTAAAVEINARVMKADRAAVSQFTKLGGSNVFRPVHIDPSLGDRARRKIYFGKEAVKDGARGMRRLAAAGGTQAMVGARRTGLAAQRGTQVAVGAARAGGSQAMSTALRVAANPVARKAALGIGGMALVAAATVLTRNTTTGAKLTSWLVNKGGKSFVMHAKGFGKALR